MKHFVIKKKINFKLSKIKLFVKREGIIFLSRSIQYCIASIPKFVGIEVYRLVMSQENNSHSKGTLEGNCLKKSQSSLT